ncbi:MAG: response regulator, partial [Deltaproteobacteria bacterium]|nr:response regulator [Deltaproteobacteria bacterium]
MTDPAEGLKKLNVLLVDDERSICISMAMMLKGKTRMFKSAGTAEDAMELLENNTWHIIICDYILPKMNGLEFFKIVEQSHPQAIKILITGFVDDGTQEKALQAGVNQILIKPLTTEAVM